MIQFCIIYTHDCTTPIENGQWASKSHGNITLALVLKLNRNMILMIHVIYMISQIARSEGQEQKLITTSNLNISQIEHNLQPEKE